MTAYSAGLRVSEKVVQIYGIFKSYLA